MATEPALLELACNVIGIRDVAVMGHADCKAMNLLEQDRARWHQSHLDESPLKTWLYQHAQVAVEHFEKLEKCNFNKPLKIGNIEAFIDPFNEYNDGDKLSQINTLVQMDNVLSYGHLKEDQAKIHGLWYDLHQSHVLYFSRPEKRFVVVGEANCEKIIHSCCQYDD